MESLDIHDKDGGTLQIETGNRNDSVDQFARYAAGATGLIAAAFVILAEDGFGPPSFDGIGKAIFWTGSVLTPLLIFNRDVLRFASSLITVVMLFAVQALLVIYAFSKLQYVNFLMLAPVCLIQALLFFTPFMLIRKHKTGVWY